MRPAGAPALDTTPTRDLGGHAVAFDDAPFPRSFRGRVPVVGVAFAGTRLDGVVACRVRRDGADATRAIAACLADSRYGVQTSLVLLEGIALAGFNVVDLHALSATLGVPVLVVVRRAPDLDAVRAALLVKVRGGRRRFALVEAAGPPEPAGGLFVQRAGLSLPEAEAVIRRLCVHGRMPEPLRVAHLVARAWAVGSPVDREPAALQGGA